MIAYSPMASGLLTGAMTRERIAGSARRRLAAQRTSDFQEPQLSRNLELVSLLRTIGNRHGRSPAEVAVAWVLRNPAVTGAIVGAPAARPGARACPGPPTSASAPGNAPRSTAFC